MHDVDAAISRLRTAGMRATPQRRAVLEELAGDTSHPSVDELAVRVTQRLPGVSLSTVYKTLHELVEIGLILRIDGQVMRFDPCTDTHAHSVCSVCGVVGDLPLPDHAEASVRESAAASGFSTDAVTVSCSGVCARCASASAS